MVPMTFISFVTVRFPDVPDWGDLRLYYFTATRFAGEPQESAEFAALRFQSERAALLLRCRDSSIGAVLTPDRTTFSRPWLSNK